MIRNPDITALLIDGANCYESTRLLGFQIDYQKILRYFKVQQAMYFTALPVRGDANDPDQYNSIFKMIDHLQFNGYTLVSKEMRTYQNGTDPPRNKGNMDVEIAVSMLECARYANHIVLFSGDGDFRYAVEAVQRLGVKVTIVSTIATRPPMVADVLRRQVNKFIDLVELRPEIEWIQDTRKRSFVDGG